MSKRRKDISKEITNELKNFYVLPLDKRSTLDINLKKYKNGRDDFASLVRTREFDKILLNRANQLARFVIIKTLKHFMEEETCKKSKKSSVKSKAKKPVKLDF